MQLKPIVRNVNIINCLLTAVVALFIIHTLFPLLGMKVKYTLPAAKTVAEKKEEMTAQIQIPSSAEYMKISDENLFHPERRIPPEKKEEKPLPKPDFVLYGTLVSDSLSLAYLEDLKAPRSSPGRGKRVTPMKKGDSMSGFTLKEIETDKVVLLRGEEKLVVPVSDPLRSKQRIETTVTAAPPAQPAGTGKVSASETQPPKAKAPQAQRSHERREKTPTARYRGGG